MKKLQGMVTFEKQIFYNFFNQLLMSTEKDLKSVESFKAPRKSHNMWFLWWRLAHNEINSIYFKNMSRLK
jgi:hypothetical protein